MPIPTSGRPTALCPRGPQRRSLCPRQRGRGIMAAGSFAGGATNVPRKAFGLCPERRKEDVVGCRWPQEFALDRVPGAEHLHLAHVTERESPPQRAQRRGAIGELSHRLRALGVPRPWLHGDAAEKRRDLAELLSREPPCLVELVHAHIDEDPAAVRAEVSARRLPVP